MDIIKSRNANTLEIFMKNHIAPGTIIPTDICSGYTFLDRDDSVWEHETYNHGAGNFGQGYHSTSNIEQTWAHIKNEIKNLYNILPKDNYIYSI